MTQTSSRNLVQTVLISANLLASNAFSQTVSLNFIPDEMTVKQVTYKPYVEEDKSGNITSAEKEGVYMLNSTLNSRSCLSCVNVSQAYDGQDITTGALYIRRVRIFSTQPNTIHSLPNFTNNSAYSFELIDPLGLAERPRGQIYVLLEFSKKEIIPT